MWSRLLDMSVPSCEYGVLGSFPVAFRAGAGGDREGGDELGLEAQEEGRLVGAGAALRPQGAVVRGSWVWLVMKSPEFCGPVASPFHARLLSGEVWRPAMVSPIAARASPRLS